MSPLWRHTRSCIGPAPPMPASTTLTFAKNSVSWKASLSGAREATKAWRPAPENLDRICCFLHQRSVSNDNVVPGDGRRLPIPPQPHRFSFAGAKVQLYESLHGYIAIYCGETKLLHSGGKVQSRGVTFLRCYNGRREGWPGRLSNGTEIVTLYAVGTGMTAGRRYWARVAPGGIT